MRNNFLFGAVVGVLAAYVWRQISVKSGKKATNLTVKELGEVAQDVIQEESGKFSNALKKQYEIIMPSDQISKKVKEKANELTERRYAVIEDNIQKPVKL